eukprot:NODE_2142_length_1500_cov_59.070443_g2038_i0.p1 GENE.NODE_2142_length_1500_cov_59.070443_g2038_i0~~NODE_2142_length_1500_cov_59.070443_g2038_i0.p1  ORF type:complete len:369 (-),score=11.11 NODE_2142_length_1500_cov_59.070443_g2038_i0:337-1443(-)
MPASRILFLALLCLALVSVAIGSYCDTTHAGTTSFCTGGTAPNILPGPTCRSDDSTCFCSTSGVVVQDTKAKNNKCLVYSSNLTAAEYTWSQGSWSGPTKMVHKVWTSTSHTDGAWCFCSKANADRSEACVIKCTDKDTCTGHGTCTGSHATPCKCTEPWTGPYCEACKVGFQYNAGTKTCDTCAPGYYPASGTDMCTKYCQADDVEWGCGGRGTCNSNGDCVCHERYTGAYCDKCNATKYIYSDYPICTECDAAVTCSNHGACMKGGVCLCKSGFTGTNCSSCVNGTYPNCYVAGRTGSAAASECSSSSSSVVVAVILSVVGTAILMGALNVAYYIYLGKQAGKSVSETWQGFQGGERESTGVYSQL